MEETIKEDNSSPSTETIKDKSSTTINTSKTKELPEVSMVRSWKEYLGESLLIIFSVVLALGLTEVINKLNDEKRTKEVLHQLLEELTENKKAEEIQLAYHRKVLKNIDSTLHNPAFAQQFIHNDSLNLRVIAPDGVLRRYLNDVAWQVAKQNNIFSKIDLSTYSLLTKIYEEQQHITNSEEEIARVLLSYESRKPENLRTTLLLMSDNYHGWAVDRAPALLKLYQQAIDKLAKY